MRYLLLAFRLPWWSYILIAFAIVLVEDRLLHAADATGPLAAEATTPAAAPALPDLSDSPATPAAGPFRSGADRVMGAGIAQAPGALTDMVLRAQIDMGHATEVVRSDADGRAVRSVLLPLAAPDATEAPTEIRAYLEVPHSRFADFSHWAAQRSDGAGRLGPLVRFEGLMTDGDRDPQAIAAALADSRRTLAPRALRFRPYIDAPSVVLDRARAEALPPVAPPPAIDRVADLLTLPEVPPLTPAQKVAAGFAGYGTALLLFGALMLKRRRRHADISGPDIYAPVDPLVPADAPAPVPPLTPRRPDGRALTPTSGDSPIDRIRARAAAQQRRRTRLFNRG